MVFDGASLPVKGDKHLERRRYISFWNMERAAHLGYHRQYVRDVVLFTAYVLPYCGVLLHRHRRPRETFWRNM